MEEMRFNLDYRVAEAKNCIERGIGRKVLLVKLDLFISFKKSVNIPSNLFKVGLTYYLGFFDTCHSHKFFK